MSDLFPKGTSSETIVKAVMLVVKARQHGSSYNIAEILSGVDPSEIDELCSLWERLLDRHGHSKALAHLTKFIESQLDDSDIAV